MMSLGVASAKGDALLGAVLDDPQLVERREDDPRGGAELGLEHLDHRGLPVTDLQHTAAGTGRRQARRAIGARICRAHSVSFAAPVGWAVKIRRRLGESPERRGSNGPVTETS